MRTPTARLQPRDARAALSRARRRLRSPLLPIMQTAASAVVAWYLAELVVDDPRPSFAAIAAVISLGATYGERHLRAAQLVGGVILGLTVADVIIQFIGSGPWQVGLMVLLAMSAAVAIGGGELLVSEAAVSAILLVALDPGADGFSLDRIAEAAIGGGVALVLSSLLFPPDPALQVGRAVQSVFAQLGGTLEQLARALEERDLDAAARALTQARATDALVAQAEEALRVGRDTARFAPPRRRANRELDRYSRTLAQVDFAVRNTRVLARHAVGAVRAGVEAPPALPEAIHELANAVWELAGAYDRRDRASAVRRHAVRSAALAAEAHAEAPDLQLSGIIGQVRSTAADLARAAALLDRREEPPTEELLSPEDTPAAA